MVSPLPLNVSWLSGETALSLFVRLAKRNFAQNLRAFAADTRLKFLELIAGEDRAVDRVANLAGIAPEQLRSTTLVHSKGGYVVNGQRVEKTSTRLRNLRSCPICLLEHGSYQRFWWTIEPCRVCVEHATPHVGLINRASPISHDFPGFVAENEKLVTGLAEAAEHVRPHAGERYLLNRLHGFSSGYTLLDSLDFSGAAKAMDVLGAVAEFGRDANLSKLARRDLIAASATGFEILSGGEAGVVGVLERMLKEPSLRSLSGPKNVFGPLFNWLYDPGMTNVNALQDVVREFCLANFAIEPGTTLLGERVEFRRLHSVVSIAKAYKLSPHTAPKVLRAAGLLKEGDTRAPGLVTFPRHEAEHVMEMYSLGLPLAGIDRYLNIPKPHRVGLFNAGYFRPMAYVAGMLPRFHPKELDAFLEKLTAKAVAVTPGSTRRSISIAKAFQYDRRCTPTRVVQLILQGQLSWIGRLDNVPGYAGIVVDYDEILEVLRGKAPVTKSSWAKEFGIGEVNAAIETLGMTVLSEISPVSNQPVFYIPAEQVEKVRNEYVSLRDISVARGHSPASVKRALAREGIFPIESKASKLYIYKRSDLI